MTPENYDKIKEKLFSICDIKPSIEQIVKYLKLMYKVLCEEWGSLSKKEILDRIFCDTVEIGLSESQIKQLLQYEKN